MAVDVIWGELCPGRRGVVNIYLRLPLARCAILAMIGA